MNHSQDVMDAAELARTLDGLGMPRVASLIEQAIVRVAQAAPATTAPPAATPPPAGAPAPAAAPTNAPDAYLTDFDTKLTQWGQAMDQATRQMDAQFPESGAAAAKQASAQTEDLIERTKGATKVWKEFMKSRRFALAARSYIQAQRQQGRQEDDNALTRAFVYTPEAASLYNSFAQGYAAKGSVPGLGNGKRGFGVQMP